MPKLPYVSYYSWKKNSIISNCDSNFNGQHIRLALKVSITRSQKACEASDSKALAYAERQDKQIIRKHSQEVNYFKYNLNAPVIGFWLGVYH